MCLPRKSRHILTLTGINIFNQKTQAITLRGLCNLCIPTRIKWYIFCVGQVDGKTNRKQTRNPLKYLCSTYIRNMFIFEIS